MVKLEMKGIAAAAITVYDLSGREAGIGVKSIEKGVHELNFSNASPGVYMVVISHASGVITRRQVVYD